MEIAYPNTAFVAAVISVLLSGGAVCCGKEPSGQRAAAGDTALESPVYSIDGDRALGYIEEIVAFGSRHPGTAGAEQTRRYIVEKLKRFGLSPVRRDFVALTPHPDFKRVSMANIYVDITGREPRKTVLIGGHFDGKIIEGTNFQGANDGGSSTGLLLEIARVLAEKPPLCPVRIVFFDGEEAFVKWSDSDSRYGSKKMAAEIKSANQVGRYAAVVIVDMIGDKRLRIQREMLSTGAIFTILEETAKRLGYGHIFGTQTMSIGDDHTPFLDIGIPSAVLIDLRFGPGFNSNAYWHTAEDTVDKLSPKSMEIVGQVVLESLSELTAETR
ncbi:MAG: M28 family peptidase [Proteobacteria bacterium]|nr:M28 family peptidase [Pseudomonadota bacterium]